MSFESQTSNQPENPIELRFTESTQIKSENKNAMWLQKSRYINQKKYEKLIESVKLKAMKNQCRIEITDRKSETTKKTKKTYRIVENLYIYILCVYLHYSICNVKAGRWELQMLETESIGETVSF